MAQRRQSEVELCFDSMTDLITNLAGGLILIVLLLLGVTREAPGRSQPKPPPPLVAKKIEAGEKPIKPLEERVRLMRLEIKSIEQNIATLGTRLPELEKQVQELADNAGKGSPAKGPKDDKDAKPKP